MRLVRLAAALLALSACGSEEPVSLAPTPPIATAAAPAETAAPAPDEPSPEPVAEAPATGRVAITVTDQNDRPRSGIPVELSGPETVRLVSDASGVARGEVRSARYTATVVPGCTEELEVVSGGNGQAAVAAGQETTGELRVEWRRRYGPALPTTYEATDGKPTVMGGIAEWRMGVPYEVRFTIVDRCGSDAPAPRAAYAAYRFEVSENASVVDAGSMRADETGIGRMRAMCNDRGVIRLTMSDTENPSEEPFDLLARATVQSGRPTCRPPSS